MTVEQQGCGDCNDQDVINTGDGAGADVIMMTGPLGDVFTKALAVYLNKKPIEGYNTTEVAIESQSQDAMLVSAVVSDIVRDNLESVKNMVNVATADDANVVPTAIAYVVPAQKVTNPETVVTVQNTAKACKMANRDFIFVVDAFKKDAVYSDFNTVVVPGDKDDKINFYNACKGFQRATESLYGSDVQVVVGFEQLSQYMVSRYKLKMSREEIHEQMSVPDVEEPGEEQVQHIAAEQPKKIDEVEPVVELTKQPTEEELAEEGFKEWLGSFFKGKPKTEEKQKTKASEKLVDKLESAKKKVEDKLESVKSEVSLNIQVGTAKKTVELKNLAQWFVAVLGSHKSIIETSIDCMNENAKSYLPAFELLAKNEYTYQDFVKLEKPLAIEQKAIFEKMVKAYKGMSHVRVGKNSHALEAPYSALTLNVPWTEDNILQISEEDFEDGDKPHFTVSYNPWPYGDKHTEYSQVDVTLSETDYKSIGMSLILALDEAIKIENTVAMQDATGVDAAVIDKLSELDEDSCYDIIKQYYKMHYLSGLYAISDRLAALSNQFAK